MRPFLLRGTRVLGCLFVLGVGAAPAVRAAAVQGIAPGKSTRAEMQQQFGAPVEGKGSAVETFAARPRGFARIVVHYDDKSVVQKAQLCPEKGLPFADAAKLFNLASTPRVENGNAFDKQEQAGNTMRYEAEGVSLFLRDGVVREIWLVAPAAAAPAPPVVPEAPRPPEPPPAPPELPPPQPGALPADTPAALREVRVNRTAEGVSPSFRTLVPGRSTRDEVGVLLGPPRFISRSGRDGFLSEYDGGKLGLRAIRVSYRPDGVAERIELCPEKPFTLREVGRAIDVGKAGPILPLEAGASIVCFPATGLELTIRQDTILNLCLVHPRSDASVPPTPAPEGPAALPKPPRLPETVPTPPPLPIPPFAQPQPAAFLRLSKTGYRHGARLGGQAGMMVEADVWAAGCQGQTMGVAARLRRADGQPVMAARGAAAYVDDRGCFCSVATDAVRFDPARWGAFRIFVPYAALDLPQGQAQELVLTVTAACAGRTVTLETPCVLRVP